MILRMMKRVRPSFFLILIVVTSCFYQSAVYYPRLTKFQIANVAERIDQSINETDPNIKLGIKIVSTKTGEVVYEHNANQLFTPASNMKLFTAIAALHILGPNYRFQTRIFTDSTTISNSIEGNLYLRGGGDPDFSDHDLEEMVNDLNVLGIREIRGDIVVDNSLFNSDSLGPGWMWDSGSSWYSAPVDAMTLNDNCVIVHVLPGKRINDPAIVRFEPSTRYISVNNKAVTVKVDSNENNLKVQRKWRTKQNVIDVTGEIAIYATPQKFTVSVESPSYYAGNVLKELLIKGGIRLEGEVRKDTLPPDTMLLSVHASEPLSGTVKNFLKISDNLTGEILVKTMGAVTDNTTGNWNNGLKAIKEFLVEEIGIDTSAFEFADGSGLSRYNLASANQIVQLLLWAYEHFLVYPEFLAALPIAGEDGTLKKRMVSKNLQRKSRAKTGTLRGVSSLSGYVLTADNETFAFSMLMNGFVGDTNPYRELQDRIVTILASFSRF